jgi:ABC transporter
LIAGHPFVELPNPTRVVGRCSTLRRCTPGAPVAPVLTIAARMAGVSTDRVEELLDRVGLADAADHRVGGYSLGMRQRLGITQTLVGDPRVLILDEPANGLDPEGIAWMRRLLRDFADHGGTVLLSSHLLHEVQATADHLVVISQGTVVASGPMDELLAGPDQTFLLEVVGGRDTDPGGSSMTTTMTQPLGAADPTSPDGMFPAIPFSRLLRVEWGKATDTRASRSLLAGVAASTVGLILAPILSPSSIEQSYTSYLSYLGFAAVALSLPQVAPDLRR